MKNIKNFTLSIVIPIYNEEKTILEILNRVKNVKLPAGIKKELVLVDDCSKDGTRNVLDKLKNNPQYKIIYHDVNKGKGAALRTGFAHATGSYVVIQDADLEYDPDEYNLLLEPVLRNQADVVFGSRFQGGRPHRILYYWHSWGNWFLTWLSNMFSDLNLTDMETCYKLIRRDIIQGMDLKENRFGFEPEITAKISELVRSGNIRLYEVGISYYGRTYDNGKKIGWKDGVRAIWCIFLYNTSWFAKLAKYALAGVLVALSQFIAITFMVELLGWKNLAGENIANLISIEVSIIVGYILHSHFTWPVIAVNFSLGFRRFVNFHLVTLGSALLRVVIFYLLSGMGVFYLYNVSIGIPVAILLNFICYDRFVFNKKIKTIENSQKI